MAKITPKAREALNKIVEEHDGDVFGAAQELYGEGICLECGATQSGCEPDAENYQCESCNSHAVMGLENALLFHYH